MTKMDSDMSGDMSEKMSMNDDSMMDMDHSWDMAIADDTSSKQALSDSPRHQEWVEIDNDGKTIYAFVVYPENKENSSAVVMIHENKGLNDWARNMVYRYI